MNGFWKPAYDWVVRLAGLWRDTLCSSLPEKFVTDNLRSPKPQSVVIEPGKNLAALFSELSSKKPVQCLIAQKKGLQYNFCVSEDQYRELASLVHFEATRALPLPLDKLSICYHSTPRKNRMGYEVELFAMRRNLLDELRLAAAEHGLALTSVQPQNSDPACQFKLEGSLRRKAARIFTRAALVAICLIIVDLAPQIYMQRLSSKSAVVEEAIVQARKNTANIAGLNEQLNKRQELASAVAAAKDGGSHAQLFHTLTKAAPDSVWFSELRIDRSQVFVKGWAVSPEEWTLDLQKLQFLSEVRLISVRSSSGDAQQFELTFSVDWAAVRIAQ